MTFPADYQAADLAGKDAVFAVTVKEVKTPEEAKIDDELAKKLGLDNLATLKDRVRDQVKGDFTAASRLHLKRRILDALDTAHSFPLPPAMVEAEFANIWAQVEAELKREGKTAADEGKTEDELKAEYHEIAERRVRLGLVLGKLGEQNGITIAGDEVQARHHGPRPPVPRPGTAGVPVLRQQSAGPGRDPRALVRGQGGGFHRRTGPGHGQAGGPRDPVHGSRRLCRRASRTPDPSYSGGAERYIKRAMV